MKSTLYVERKLKAAALSLALVALVLLASCSQHRDMGFTPPAAPRYIVPPARTSGSTQTVNGSLWVDGSRTGQVTDFRARNVNDLVTIKVVESTTASNKAVVSTERDDSGTRGLSSLLGLENRLLPRSVLDNSKAVSAKTKEEFASTGSNASSPTRSAPSSRCVR